MLFPPMSPASLTPEAELLSTAIAEAVANLTESWLGGSMEMQNPIMVLRPSYVPASEKVIPPRWKEDPTIDAGDLLDDDGGDTDGCHAGTPDRGRDSFGSSQALGLADWGDDVPPSSAKTDDASWSSELHRRPERHRRHGGGVGREEELSDEDSAYIERFPRPSGQSQKSPGGMYYEKGDRMSQKPYKQTSSLDLDYDAKDDRRRGNGMKYVHQSSDPKITDSSLLLVRSNSGASSGRHVATNSAASSSSSTSRQKAHGGTGVHTGNYGIVSAGGMAGARGGGGERRSSGGGNSHHGQRMSREGVEHYGRSFFESAMHRLHLPMSTPQQAQRIQQLARQEQPTQALEGEKRRVKTELKNYDISFARKYGVMPGRTEKEPMRPLYAYYRRVKAALDRSTRKEGFGGNGGGGSSAGGQHVSRNRPQGSGRGVVDGRDIYVRMDGSGYRRRFEYLSDDVQRVAQDADIGDQEKKLQKLHEQKLQLRQKLQQFQDDFLQANGRKIKFHRDILPVENEYKQYKQLKEYIAQLAENIRKRKALLQ